MEPNAKHDSGKSKIYRILAISLVFALVAASWIGNLIYYQAHQLDEPVFLEHQYELSVHPEEMLELYYITHRNDEKQLTHIRPIPLTDAGEEVSPLNDGITDWRVVHSAPYGTYGPYQVHKASVQRQFVGNYDEPGGLPSVVNEDWDTAPIESESDEDEQINQDEEHVRAERGAEIYFQQMEAWFQEGSSYVVDIGSIRLLPWDGSSSPPWSGVSGRSSSTGESSSTVRIDKDLEIAQVELALESRIGDIVSYQLYEGEPDYPLEQGFDFEQPTREALQPSHRLTEGNHFTVETLFQIPDGDSRQNHAYLANLRLQFNDWEDDGESYFMFHRLHHSPWLNRANVIETVNQHREGS